MAAEPNAFVGYDIVQVFLKNLLFVIDRVKISEEQRQEVKKIISRQLAISFFPIWMRRAYHNLDYGKKLDVLKVLNEYYKRNFYYLFFVKPAMLLPDPFSRMVVFTSSVFNKFRSFLFNIH
jgi:hypothetical protein